MTLTILAFVFAAIHPGLIGALIFGYAFVASIPYGVKRFRENFNHRR